MKPITPDEVTEGKLKYMPPEVIKVFNELISKHYLNGVAVVPQGEIVGRLSNIGFSRTTIFENNLLDVEPLYEAAGWNVTYDKPGYNETYEASFTFRKKRK